MGPNLLKHNTTFRPALVFCSTRGGTIQAAKTLVEQHTYLRQAVRVCVPAAELGGRGYLLTKASEIEDSTLQGLIPQGVAVHHAGLSMNDLRRVEGLFNAGAIPVLFATSTLAMGVWRVRRIFPAQIVSSHPHLLSP